MTQTNSRDKAALHTKEKPVGQPGCRTRSGRGIGRDWAWDREWLKCFRLWVEFHISERRRSSGSTGTWTAGPLAHTEAVGRKRARLVAEEFVLVVHFCLNVSCYPKRYGYTPWRPIKVRVHFM